LATLQIAPTLADIQEARRRLQGIAVQTPIYLSETFSRRCGREVRLKAENLQRTGAFKIRGAVNKLSTLSPEEREAGVVAASAGNHGQAVAWAARQLGLRARIFVPDTAPMAKVEACKNYGAETELTGSFFEDAMEAARAYVEERRAPIELKLERCLRRSQHGLVIDERGIRLIEDAGRVVRELGTPWTNLLAELEVASRDTQGQIAVLSVEPDHEKHRVHITGESRDLPLALAYVRRLQSSRALRYPMLDSHEVRADDAQRPVRFAMTAEWSGLP